jgi:hypothetical protein
MVMMSNFCIVKLWKQALEKLQKIRSPADETECYDLFSRACEKLTQVIYYRNELNNVDQVVQKEPQSHTAVYLLSYCQFDKARKLVDLHDLTAMEYDNLMKSALSNVEAAVQLKPDDGYTTCLWATILLNNARKVSNSPAEQELLLVQAAEKFFKCAEFEKMQLLAFHRLSEIQELLINGVCILRYDLLTHAA